VSTTAEKIAVMQASEDGAEIEHTVKNKTLPWLDTDEPWWDWVSFEYRIKPEPLTLWVVVDWIGRYWTYDSKETATASMKKGDYMVKMKECQDDN